MVQHRVGEAALVVGGGEREEGRRAARVLIQRRSFHRGNVPTAYDSNKQSALLAWAPAGRQAGRMAIDRGVVLADLAAEGAELDAMVAGLAPADWGRDTPAAGWTIAHQIAHLAWTEERMVLAITDPPAFLGEIQGLTGSPESYVDEGAAEGAKRPPEELLAQWRGTRQAVQDALLSVPEGARVVWYGPPMQAPSLATARMMETWAHGQDVADALGVVRTPTDRLRHVAHLGYRTRDFAYGVRGLTPPAEPFRVELSAPDGSLWAFGPADAAQRVTGPALDFCLLTAQRRHRADLALDATGPDAERWLEIAQSFAGPSGPGRQPGQG
jgi:uncharacterized protein (TIGR03084 family)